MKIKFSNLGAIKETELDLRPLTVIIGPNNSNKTYIAYSVYGLLRQLTEDPFQFLDGLLSDKVLGQNSDGTFSLCIPELEKAVHEFNRRQENRFKKNLENFFQDSSQQLFSKTSLTVELSLDEVTQTINRVVEYNRLESPDASLELLSFEENVLLLKPRNGSENDTASKEDRIWGVAMVLSYLLLPILFSKPFLLPAERNAFIITYKMLANRRYKLLRQNQRGLIGRGGKQERQQQLFKEQGDIRYPQPVEDFLDFLTDVEFDQGINSPRQKNEFQKLADDVETHIQFSNRTDFKPTVLGGKELKVNVRRGLSIDLYNASSSIKQLAPLLLYLRYRAAETIYLSLMSRK
jgi:hypothetical protein